MRIIVTEFQGEAPVDSFLEEGRDYSQYEAEFDEGETILLLRRLRPSRSRVLLKGEASSAEFQLEPKREISVEISSLKDAFWAISEVNQAEAESIVRLVYRRDDFTDTIPGTDREWDAWGDGM